MNIQKYIIYENDLKFRKFRNLDKTRIDWTQNNISHLYDINHDTLEYRILESERTNNSEIDLRHLDLTIIPQIINTTKFNNLHYLFLSNNKLQGSFNFSGLLNLQSLDLDYNDITNITLPTNLLELSINNNKLTELKCNDKLIRLKASHNILTTINLNNNLEILEVDNNKFIHLNIDNLSKLHRFIIFSNPLINFKITPSLSYVDISETNIKQINYDILNCNIETLVANTCKNLTAIPQFNMLKNLEIINTPVDKLYYYDNYELIIIQFNLTKNISKKYKENNANIQIRNNILLVISKGNIQIN
jgi:hypothetical protein